MGFDTHTGLLAVSQHSRKRTSGFRFSARFKGLIAYSCLPDLLIAILVQAFPLTTNKRLTSATIHTLYRFTLRFRYCVVHGETGIQRPSCLYIPRSVERLLSLSLIFSQPSEWWYLHRGSLTRRAFPLTDSISQQPFTAYRAADVPVIWVVANGIAVTRTRTTFP